MSKEIQQFGLEFINDLAKDRKLAVETLGVSFSSFRTRIRESQIITRTNDYNFMEELLKNFREEVNRSFESQLTRISIKSFGWIKRVLMQGDKILVRDESQEQELQNRIQHITNQLNTKTSEIKKLHTTNEELSTLLLDKEQTIQEIKSIHQKQVNELQQEIVSEKARAKNLATQIDSLQEEMFEYKLEFEEKSKRITALEGKNTQLDMEIASKASEIDRLTHSLSEARRTSATDDDVADAMQQWAISYQAQEEHFQNSLSQLKEEYEGMIEEKLNENTNVHQKELEEVTTKLSDEKSKREEFQSKTDELTMKNEYLAEREKELDSQVSKLLEKLNQLETDLRSQKSQYEQLLEGKSKQKEEEILALKDIQYAKIQGRAEWLEQCLSFSNFAPITILLRMGNEMKLDSLAKSVGMDPIVLDQQLQELHRRDLIDIRHDGTIVANVPALN
jgi:chromosome segregation ATPase